jgi:DegV family protein with EDD domain
MSGTFSSVSLVLQEIQRKYPERKMAIIDTESGSVATGIILMQVLSMIEAKYAYEEVVALAKEMSGHVEHRFLVSDLNWLAKSGRINKAVAVTGRIMGVKPVLHVQEGKIKMLKVIRGSSRYLHHLASIICEGCKEFQHQIIGIAYADDRQIADDLAGLIQEKLQGCRILVTRIGSVLASHLGMGGVGAFFMKNQPSYYHFEFAND